MVPRLQPVGASAFTADIDVDGWEDVVSVTGQDSVQVHFTRAEGGLRPGAPSPALPGSWNLRPGHFDPGPTLDLLVLAAPGASTPASSRKWS